MIPEFTVVLGLDAHTIRFFEITVSTWKHFFPELWDRPWLVFFDSSQVQYGDIISRCLGAKVSCAPWHGGPNGYQTQREKMLCGHVYVSEQIETPYFLKIDADAVAIASGDWPKAEWFEGDPVLVGPSWGYWRAKGNDMTLVQWARELEAFGTRHFGTPEAGWESRITSWNHPKGPKLRDKNRFVSWLAFQKTSWVRDMAKKFAADYGDGQLPVPSHDTSLWAAAVRSNALVRTVGVKPCWTNRATLRGCRRAVGELEI